MHIIDRIIWSEDNETKRNLRGGGVKVGEGRMPAPGPNHSAVAIEATARQNRPPFLIWAIPSYRNQYLFKIAPRLLRFSLF